MKRIGDLMYNSISMLYEKKRIALYALATIPELKILISGMEYVHYISEVDKALYVLFCLLIIFVKLSVNLL